MTGIALVLPPGWTLHPGGPHIALPLLKGFLQNHNIETKIYDLNIGSTQYHQVHIFQKEVNTACDSQSRASMNAVYFKAEDRLQAIAQAFDGTWFAHEGFRRNGCNIASGDHIREASLIPSPFTEYLEKDAIPEILKTQPRIVGISITVPTQILQTFELVRLLRKAGYRGCIVLGGNVISRLHHDMATDWVFDLIDGLIHLQGERTLLDIYTSLKESNNLSKVPNLTWRDQGIIRKNSSETLKPIDFAPPDFSDLPFGKYWGTNYLTMVAGRGCYYGKCSFCSIPYGYGERGYIGSSPASKVVKAMKSSSEKTGIHRFKFIDEALHPKMLKDLAPLIQEESLDVQFEAYLRLEPSWLRSDLLQMGAKAGLKKVYLGLELVPGDKRDLLEKADNADPLRLLTELKDAGIRSHVFCMFGFPGTGIKEAFNTVEFALKHSDLIDTLDIFPFYYARYTQVQGVIKTDDPKCTWNVEHSYKPAAPHVLPPSKVTILAEQLGNVVWSEQPQWLHPIYRMHSPWN